MNDIECDVDGNEDGGRNGGRNGDDVIKTKHDLNKIIEMISKLSNVIAITTTFIQCRPLFVNTYFAASFIILLLILKFKLLIILFCL